MRLEEFNRKYEYRADIIKFKRKEHWTIIEPDINGKYTGDCEDYALTLQDKVDGYSKIELWYCKLQGNGHCVGILNGQVIDCNTKQLMDKDEYIKKYTITGLRKYWWLEIKLKILQAKIQRLFK